MVRLDGSTGIGHTLDAYRGRGLYNVVTANILLKSAQAGLHSFDYHSKQNRPILHVADTFQREVVGEVVFTQYMPSALSKL